MTHPITRGKSEKGRNAAVPGAGEAIPCGCGEHFFVPRRPNQKYETRLCKDRARNRLIRLRARSTIKLAMEVQTLAERAHALARSVLEPEEKPR